MCEISLLIAKAYSGIVYKDYIMNKTMNNISIVLLSSWNILLSKEISHNV